MDRAHKLIAEAEAAAKFAGGDWAFETGWLRGTVLQLCAEIDEARRVKCAPDLLYIEVEHEFLGAVELGVCYTPPEPATEDEPPLHESFDVIEVWLRGKDIAIALEQGVVDELQEAAEQAFHQTCRQGYLS